MVGEIREWLVSYEEPLPLETYALWSLVYGAVAVVVGIMITLYSPKRKSALPTSS